MNYPEPDLDDLYRELILDHYRHPRNRGTLERRSTHVEGYNPLCGDEVEVELLLDPEGTIEEVAFKGRGCSISQASSSMMTAAVKGRSRVQALELMNAFKRMMTNPEEEPVEELGDLEAFQGVAKFPVRVKCATLAWNTLQEGLEQNGGRAVQV
jgi:nitrogen fixation protein NifU and related proteins